MRISDWSSDVCSSDLHRRCRPEAGPELMQISADRIRAIEARRDEVQANMARSDLAAEEFVRLSKEYAELEPVAKAAHEVRRLRQELKALAIGIAAGRERGWQYV